MILRSIRIEGVRQFRNPVQLSDLGVGAHVVHAPNEKGKSTIFTAVARALCDKYSTRGSEIEEMRPWGTDLSPAITLEIEAGGKRYRLRKRFLDGAESVLDEWTGDGYERLADAQSADDRARSFIDGSLPGRGATSIGHWGVAQLLWLPQDPTRHDLPRFEPLRQRLLALVGATTLGPQEQSLVDKISAACQTYFTPKTGKAAKGSVIWELEQKHSGASDELAKWKQVAEEAFAIAEGLTEAEQELETFATESRAYRAELAELKDRVKAEFSIDKQVVAMRGDWEKLKLRFSSIENQRSTLATLQEKRERARKLAADLAPRVDAARIHVEHGATERAAADGACSAARKEWEEAMRCLERVRAIEKGVGLANERRRLSELVEKAERITATLVKREAEAAIPAPTEAEVRKAETLERDISQLQAQLDSVGLEVAFTAEVAANVTWKTSDGHEQKRPKAGDRVVFRGADTGTLTMAGIGVIQVRSGADEVSSLKEKLADRRIEYSRRLGERQVKDFAQLRDLREAAKAREQAIGTLKDKLADVLTDDHNDLESARDALRKTSGHFAELLEQFGLEEAGLETESGADAKRLTEEAKTAKNRLALREDEAKEAFATTREAEKRFTEIEKEFAGHEREATTFDAQHSAAMAANGSLESLSAEAIRLGGEAALAEAAAKGLEEKLPPVEQRATARQKRVEEVLEGLSQKGRIAQDRVSRGRALLDRAGTDGAYSRLCEAEEKVALLDERLARERRRAEALKLLSDLAEAQRERASRSLVDPVEKEVRIRLGYLRGETATRVELAFGDGLDDVELARPGGVRLPLTALSWGAQEQAMFTLRLALGAMLSREGRDPQLIVLDDALVNTDQQRHGRAVDLIQSAAEHMQVFVLTAFPERYRTLRAKEYDLVALARG